MKKYNYYIYLVVLGLFFAFPQFINAENPTPGMTIVNDDFNDGNDNGWTRVRGEWRVDKWPPDIEDWQYYVSTGEKSISVRNDVDCGNCIIDFEVAPNEGSVRMGVVFNYQDENNFYVYWFDHSQGVGISKYVNGARTDIAGVTQVSSVWNVKQRLEISEKTIKAFSDGIEVLRYENDSLTQGKVGLMSDGDGGNFDDFAVYDYKVCHWSCGEWSMCRDNVQIRVCTETNSCGTFDNKPEENKICDYCYSDKSEKVLVPQISNWHTRISPVAMNDAGMSIVAWSNVTSDAVGGAVIGAYAQLFRYGQAVGEKFLVNDNKQKSEIQFVQAGMDKDGNFIVAWLSSLPNNKYAIELQRFDINKNKLGTPIIINDAYEYEMALADNGNFSVVYSRPTGIYLQLFNKNGDKAGGGIPIGDSWGNFSIKYNNQGKIIVGHSYTDKTTPTENSSGVFLVIFDVTGRKIKNSFRVNENVEGNQSNSSIAVDQGGGFVISWTDEGRWEANDWGIEPANAILAQRFDANGNTIGNNFKITGVWCGAGCPNIASAITGNNEFILTTYDWAGLNHSAVIKSVAFNNQWQKINKPILVNNNDPGNHLWPDMAVNARGDIFYSWLDFQGATSTVGIKFAKISDFYDTTSINKEFLAETNINQSSGNYMQDVAIDLEGNFVVTWMHQDPRGGYPSIIFAQRFDKFGYKHGEKFRVNSSIQHYFYPPRIAMDPSGNFIIIWSTGWCDFGNCNSKILAQRFNRDGNKIGSELNLSVTDAWAYTGPSIDMDGEGNFLVTWIKTKTKWPSGSDNFVALQRFAYDGTKIGEELSVTTSSLDNQEGPALSMNALGNFVISWVCNGQQGQCTKGVYTQKFDSNGNKIGNAVRTDNADWQWYSKPDVAIDSAGNFIVSWTQFMHDIYAQRFDNNGNKVGEIIPVFTNWDNRFTGFDRSAVANDSVGNFVISTENLLTQRFDRNGDKVGSAFYLNATILQGGGPLVAMDARGNYVAIWGGMIGSDPLLNYGVYIRIFRKECSVTCSNGVKDLVEVDVDCGGQCGKCAQEKGCNIAIDCQSNYCNPNNICSIPNCSDGFKNQDEVDVDCGGVCGACSDGKICKVPGDCHSNYCSLNNICATPVCNDGVKNGSETGIDCGGSCLSCPCIEKWQCGAWSVCKDGKQTRTCTDINACEGGRKKPAEEQICSICFDGIKNQNEERVDCGGVCRTCGNKCVPDLINGRSDRKIDIVFIPASDYGSDITKNVLHSDGTSTSFLDDYVAKRSSFLSLQDIKEHATMYNFYFSRETGDLQNLSLPGGNANYLKECPFVDSAVFLHTRGDYRDRSRQMVFTANGNPGPTFIHEISHAIFGLKDEYDDSPECLTTYEQVSPNPNIWSSEAGCHASAISTRLWQKSDCNKFTDCGKGGGWWKMSKFSDNIMINGYPTYRYDIASHLRIDWVFDTVDRGFIESNSFGTSFAKESAPKSVMVTFNINNGVLTKLDESIIEGFSPNQVAGDGIFSITAKDGDNNILEQFNIIDPRVVYYQEDESMQDTFLTATDFTVIFPFYPKLETLSIVDSTSIATQLTANISSVIKNYCQGSPSDADCHVYDLDGDGIVGTDNCPTISNPDQLDSNSNGVGDACEPFLRGNSNSDSIIDLSDAIYILTYLFSSTDIHPKCIDAMDANDDGKIDIADAVYILSWLFTGGTGPKAPGWQSPGVDPTPDAFMCAS